MPQVGTVSADKLAAVLDEFLSADNASQTEAAMEILAKAYAARANVYRDAKAAELEMTEDAVRDHILYFTHASKAAEQALRTIRETGEKLVMPA